jgi:hypothetical protein
MKVTFRSQMKVTFQFCQLSRLRHPYLAEFYGIFWSRNTYFAVYERPGKGTLHDVLAEVAIFSDIELRLILTANLIEVKMRKFIF